MIDREERLEAPTKRKIDAGDWGGERRSRGKVKRGGGSRVGDSVKLETRSRGESGN